MEQQRPTEQRKIQVPSLPPGIDRAGMKPYYAGWHYLLRAAMPTLCFPRVEGLEHIPRSGAALLVANHLSMVDPPLLIGYVPRHIHWLTKVEAFEQWPLGVILPPGEPIKVNRGKVDRAALRAAEEYLRHGQMIGIFAEGHRSEAGAAQEARAGVVYLAQRSDALLVPAGIWGTEHVFSSRFPWYRHVRVGLRFGKPFRLSDLPSASQRRPDREQLAHDVMARVAALLPVQYRGVYAGEITGS